MLKRAISFKNLLNYLAVFIVFAGAITCSYLSFAELRISYVIMGLILLIWLPALNDFNFNNIFLLPFLLILIFSVYNVFLEYDTPRLLFKQALGIFINASWFYMFIKINKEDIKNLFEIYLNIAFIVALIGLIQEISCLVGFKPGYDYSYMLPFWKAHLSSADAPYLYIRINSILPEPAGFCISMMPAFFVSLVSLLRKRQKILGTFRSLIILVAFILSFSSVGYLGIFFSIFLIILNYRKLKYFVMLTLIFAIFSFLMYRSNVDFKTRIDDSFGVLLGKADIENTNFSTFASYSNALIVYNNLKNKPFIGSGLGSHELTYMKFINKVINTNLIKGYVNVKDASSLFLRLLSETGIFGLLLFLIFIINFHLKKKADTTDYLWVINNAILAMFIVRLIRVGHYFTDGFFLFFWMYYFSKMQSKKLI